MDENLNLESEAREQYSEYKDGLITESKHTFTEISKNKDYDKYIDHSVESVRGKNEQLSTLNKENLKPIYQNESLPNSDVSEISVTGRSSSNRSAEECVSQREDDSCTENTEESIVEANNRKMVTMKASFHREGREGYFSHDRKKRKKKKKHFNMTTKFNECTSKPILKDRKTNYTASHGELLRRRAKTKPHTITSSTRVSQRRSKRKSQNSSVSKSRNKFKSCKGSKKRMFIETTKNSVLCKLVPSKDYYPRMNITPIGSEVCSAKHAQKPSDDKFEVIRKMNKLKYELREKQAKLRILQEKCRDNKKKLKDRRKKDHKRKDNIEFLEYKLEEMRLNEEQLIDDLYNQQNMAKDAIRSMENLAKQFEGERSKFKRESEKQIQILVKKEAKMWQYKVESLKTVNDTLTRRIQGYEEQEQMLAETEEKNTELKEQIVELEEDLERVRGERKGYKEENHKLMKRLIHMEEIVKLNKSLVTSAEEACSSKFKEQIAHKNKQINHLTAKIQSCEHESQKRTAKLQKEIELLKKELLEERFKKEDNEMEIQKYHKYIFENDKKMKNKDRFQDSAEDHFESTDKDTSWIKTYKSLSKDLHILRQEIHGLRDSPQDLDNKENLSYNTMNQKFLKPALAGSSKVNFYKPLRKPLNESSKYKSDSKPLPMTDDDQALPTFYE
ncbi:unnamed protein product [Moneuplotes crassus]|uniref:Uncharacterized protein n=1 Tax=Euplotes crassus TaxID=5936 RepID=A0AAD1Y9Z6_EUPCR|nr:unnamed protein product [Moneuplotes crassus]